VTDKLVKDVGTKNPELVQEGLLKTTLKPDKYQETLATTAKEKVQGFGSTKNPVKNAKLVNKAIAKESDDLLNSLQSNDPALPHQEIGHRVSTKVNEAAMEFGDQPGVFDSTKRMWNRISEKHPGNASGQWKARIEFYKEAESKWGSSIFDKGTARAEAVRAVGQGANETIEAAAQRAGRSFKKEIDTISQLYDVKENLGTKFSAKGPVKKFLNSPVGRAAAYTTAGTAVGAVGLRTLGQ
jgi:hypothetical protein